jgi:hypothetical protein
LWIPSISKPDIVGRTWCIVLHVNQHSDQDFVFGFYVVVLILTLMNAHHRPSLILMLRSRPFGSLVKTLTREDCWQIRKILTTFLVL